MSQVGHSVDLSSRLKGLPVYVCFYVQVRVPAPLLEDMRVLGVADLFDVLELCLPAANREYTDDGRSIDSQ